MIRLSFEAAIAISLACSMLSFVCAMLLRRRSTCGRPEWTVIDSRLIQACGMFAFCAFGWGMVALRILWLQ